MTPLTAEWVQKAEGDFEAMTRMARVRNRAAILDAVAFRYPGESASREAAREAVVCCKKVRLALRETLGLEIHAKLRKQSRKER